MKAETVTIGSAELAVRPLDAGDREPVLALHRRVFGSAVDAAWYDWKYGAGQGRGRAVGVWHGSALVAHCAGIPRALWHAGRPARGLQIGDVMVDPAWRGILTRRGPFFQACRRLYDDQLGTARAQQIGFGFPNQRHLRLAVMLGLSWDGGTVDALRWDTAGALPLPGWQWRWAAIDAADERLDADADGAWQAMRRAAGTALTLGQRDAGYLRWRYLQRPDQGGYRLFRLRRPWSRQAQGIAVLRPAGTDWQWLDWIGPPQLLPLAAQACRHQAAGGGGASLSAWLSPVVADRLAGSGVRQRETVAWVGIPCASALSAQEAAGLRLWFMGGDTDFL